MKPWEAGTTRSEPSASILALGLVTTTHVRRRGHSLWRRYYDVQVVGLVHDLRNDWVLHAM